VLGLDAFPATAHPGELAPLFQFVDGGGQGLSPRPASFHVHGLPVNRAGKRMFCIRNVASAWRSGAVRKRIAVVAVHKEYYFSANINVGYGTATPQWPFSKVGETNKSWRNKPQC